MIHSMVVKINQIKSFNFALVCSLYQFVDLITLQILIEIVYCLDFAPNCTKIGKFVCASSSLCLSKSIFTNQHALNCTSVEGGLCQSNPCGDNSICYDPEKFLCGCKPGWKGQTCDTESKFTQTGPSSKFSQSKKYYDGSVSRLVDRHIDQVSDLPSIIFIS